MDTHDTRRSAEHFLNLIKESHRGKFKVYIGMIAGVGKSYRMLQEAHELLENGVDVQIGYIETHGRAGTEALLQGLPVISRRKIFYKGKELEEMNITILLGPSLNIHRDPLCGRNFEYFSEDPVISGTMASAITLGVQEEPGVGACLKHFSANNQETDRSGTDSIVSERALREIYLKGFEIAVKESKPMSIMTSYNQINGVPAADSYDMNTNIARGEWGFEGLIMTDWNGGVSHPSTSMHAGNDLIMPGGASKANEIIIGAEDVKPTFEANGQIGLKDELMYMFSYKSAAWGDFEVSADGTQTAEAKLGDDYTASVGEDGKILVNGQEIYREYQANVWAGTGNYKTPVTTDVASVSEDGKTIVYKGTYKENNNICLGDVQKSAINNLNIIMNSNMMQRRYGVEVKDYSTALGNLKAYQSVTKDSVQKASANVESLNKVIAMVEELNASDYTKASWAAVEEALNAAKAVAAKADATAIETTNAMTDLLAAMNSLEQGVEKTHLEISIKEAEKVLVRADKYSSLGNLEEAVANGKAVLANEDADQETVSAAATAILNELSKAVKNADLSSLESLIKSAKKLQDGNYTSNSLAKLDEVIKAAEAVVANKNRTAEEVNKAYSDLIDAVISLEKKGNKAALKAMLEKAAAVLEDSDAYVAATIEGLADVKADAQAVYDNDDAVQNEVNAAVRTLTLKLAEARLLGDVDNDGAVTTADSTALLAASAELTELDADAAAAADVNGDGVADTGDAALILEYAAEKVAGF